MHYWAARDPRQLFTGPRSACHSAKSLLLMNIIAWGPQLTPNIYDYNTTAQFFATLPIVGQLDLLLVLWKKSSFNLKYTVLMCFIFHV